MLRGLSDPAPATPPGSLRSPTGRGRPYPAEVVATVRGLVEGTRLRFDEIAARTGICPATIGTWARRFGWARVGGSGAWSVARAGLAPAAARSRRPPRRHSPETREAARAAVVGTRLSLERIGLDLGVGTRTLRTWQKRFGWRRPAPPDKRGPMFYRSRRRGRPYGGDAVGRARDLVTGSRLPLHRIAAQAGVSQSTVSRWMARRGWLRPPAKPGTYRHAMERREAPTISTGDRRGRPYPPKVVAAARQLWQQTSLPTVIVAARAKVTPERVAHWARTGGWTRPAEMPDPHGRYPRRRR